MDQETLQQAAKALLDYCRAKQSMTDNDSNTHSEIQPSEKNSPFHGDEGHQGFVSVIFALKVPPKQTSFKPHPLPLPHPLYSVDDDDICFFVKDPQRLVKDHLAEQNVTGINKVLGVSKLHKKYGTHEGRRELCRAYDLFLVDDRVMPMMPRLLGNPFIQEKKLPMVVRMDGDIPDAIAKTLRCTSFLPGTGTTCSVRIGKLHFTSEKIAENTRAAVESVAALFPKGLDAFQAVYIKADKSPALPVFFSLPTASDFAPDAEEKAARSLAIRKKKSKEAKRRLDRLKRQNQYRKQRSHGTS